MKAQIILHCDACHHEVGVETITEADINRPCPICGTSLVTLQDYVNWKVIQTAMESAKSLGLLVDKPGPDTVTIKQKFISKDGDLTICQPEKIEEDEADEA